MGNGTHVPSTVVVSSGGSSGGVCFFFLVLEREGKKRRKRLKNLNMRGKEGRCCHIVALQRRV